MVVCVVYWRYLKSAVILQCTLEGIQAVGDECIRWKSVPLGFCSGKEAVFVVVAGGGYLSVFVWVVGSYFTLCGLEVLVGIDVYEIVCYFVLSGKSGEEGRCQGGSRYFPAVIR